MSVSYEYLSDMRRYVRRSSSSAVDLEVADQIEMCRAEMISLNVPEDVANDETDLLVKKVIVSFLRWYFGIGDDEKARKYTEYRVLLDELRWKKAETEETT